MRKTTTAILAFAASILLAATASTAQASESESEEHSVTSHVTLTDLETGEVLYSESKEVPVPEEGALTVPSDIELNDNAIQPLGSIGSTFKPGGVESSISISYTRRTEDIRIDHVSGSWSPDFSVEVKNRRVLMINGGVFTEKLEKFPYANSYSYSTGFGFAIWNSGAEYVPRVLAEVDHRIAGTGGNWVRLSHWLDLSDV
ncbi:hypothetical protein [Microbacterium suaedae]|uniref:hypothetical protein n=1 Tax=Microbacterium suaedae TaxID=2067813 RepID=UPI0013A67B13|nr:hypothetical protein [Microbacterium suaedae]